MQFTYIHAGIYIYVHEDLCTTFVLIIGSIRNLVTANVIHTNTYMQNTNLLKYMHTALVGDYNRIGMRTIRPEDCSSGGLFVQGPSFLSSNLSTSLSLLKTCLISWN